MAAAPTSTVPGRAGVPPGSGPGPVASSASRRSRSSASAMFLTCPPAVSPSGLPGLEDDDPQAGLAVGQLAGDRRPDRAGADDQDVAVGGHRAHRRFGLEQALEHVVLGADLVEGVVAVAVGVRLVLAGDEAGVVLLAEHAGDDGPVDGRVLPVDDPVELAVHVHDVREEVGPALGRHLPVHREEHLEVADLRRGGAQPRRRGAPARGTWPSSGRARPRSAWSARSAPGAMPAARWASSTASGTARMLELMSGMNPSHSVSSRVNSSLSAATGGASMVSGAWISTPIFTPSSSASGSSRSRIAGLVSTPDAGDREAERRGAAHLDGDVLVGLVVGQQPARVEAEVVVDRQAGRRQAGGVDDAADLADGGRRTGAASRAGSGRRPSPGRGRGRGRRPRSPGRRSRGRACAAPATG